MIKYKIVNDTKSIRKEDVILKNEGFDFNKFANQFRNFFNKEIKEGIL